MRSIRLILLIGVFSLFGCSPTLPLYQPIKPVVFSPQTPESWELSNGIKVIYLPDQELPFVRMSLNVPGGTLWQPKDNLGAVSAMGSLLAAGGAGERSAEEFEKELTLLSASVTSSFGPEFGGISFSCLEPDLETVFSLFSDAVFRPRFQQSRIDLLKVQSLEAIRRRKDEPSNVAIMAFDELVYGKESPYAKLPSSEDVKKINRDVIVSLYKKFFQPNSAVIAVSGKITKEKANELLEREIGRWQTTENFERKLPPITGKPLPGIYFIEQPVTQASIVAGHLGVPRMTDDQYAILGFNQVFGGGLELSRLFDRIRTKRGLAYDVSGAILAGPVKGRNVIYLQTKKESAGDALLESIATLESMQNELISETEYTTMRQGTVNSFVFSFASPGSIVSRKTGQILYGYPEDYDQTFTERIMALTPADIKEVANRRWNKDQLVVVIVGSNEVYKRLEAVFDKLPEGLKERPIKKLMFNESLNEVPRL